MDKTNHIAILDLPKFLKEHVIIPATARDKSKLDALLVQMLEDFFSVPRLILDPTIVEQELSQISNLNTEKILSKLRSLLEKQARKDIAHYCAHINSTFRSQLIKEMHRAGIHHFRENIETDLYVGIHTAISANFKMIGLVFTNSAISVPEREQALSLLFKALRCVASHPLGVLLTLDGLFWDRQLYSIPTEIYWHSSGASKGMFYINTATLSDRIASAQISEIPLGCPAMRARINTGERAIDFLQRLCLETANKYCQAYTL